METKTWDSFIGGEQASSKWGYENGFQDGLGLDYVTDPDKLTALKRLIKESGSTVVDLIKWQREYNGYVFAFGDAGHLYRRNTSAAWSDQRTVSNSLGQGLGIFNTLNQDALWYANTSTLGRAITLTGTMSFDDDYLDTAELNRDPVARNIPSSFATPYSLVTTIAETVTHKQTVIANKIMCKGFKVYVTAKGTSADWTLTLHDSTNAVVATSTVTNANLTNTAYNNFYFSAPVELTLGGEYHYHLTASNTTGTPTAGTGTNNDLEDGAYYLVWPSLVSDNYYHPIQEFSKFNCIGNGQFLATMDDSEVWDPERLDFGRGQTVRMLEVMGDYLAIFTWRYNDITKVKESVMYLWDGVSPTKNNIIPIKDGQANAATTYGNVLFMMNGTKGQLSAYNANLTPIRRINDVGENKTIEIYPDAFTVYNGLIYIGIGAGTSTTCPRCVYTYGTNNKDYPMALNKAYPTSSDNTQDIIDKTDNNDVQIGSIIGIGNTLLVSWKNGSAYGVDSLSTTKDQNRVYMTTMRFDAETPYLIKQLSKVIITHSPIRTEDSITVQVRYNNQGTFTNLFVCEGDSDKDALSKTFTPGTNIEFMEIEFRVFISGAEDLASFYSLTLEYLKPKSIRTQSVKAKSI